MHCYKRGRTGGINRHARPAQPKDVRYTACGGIEAVSRGIIGVEVRGPALRDELSIVARAHTDEDASLASNQLAWKLASALQRLPGDLQEDALLGIHTECFAGRDVEELRVEPVDLVKKPTVARIHRADRVWVGVVVGVFIPPAHRNLRDRVPPAMQKSPERFGLVGTAREPACQAIHCE